MAEYRREKWVTDFVDAYDRLGLEQAIDTISKEYNIPMEQLREYGKILEFMIRQYGEPPNPSSGTFH